MPRFIRSLWTSAAGSESRPASSATVIGAVICTCFPFESPPAGTLVAFPSAGKVGVGVFKLTSLSLLSRRLHGRNQGLQMFSDRGFERGQRRRQNRVPERP